MRWSSRRALAALVLFLLALVAGPHARAQGVRASGPVLGSGLAGAGPVLGAPLAAGGPTSWTPARSSPYFCLDASDAATLTISASPVPSSVIRAGDACGSALVLNTSENGNFPTLDTAVLVGGRPSLMLDSGSFQSLYAASGGLTSGTQDHTLCAAGWARQITSYNGWIVFGTAATSPAGAVSTVGNAANAWEAIAGSGPGTPITDAPFEADLYPHLLCKTVTSQVVDLWVDGVHAISGVTDLGYDVQPGFGLGPFYPGFFPDANVLNAFFYTRAISTADRRSLEQWEAHRYQLGSISCLGDSLCYGYPGGNGESSLYFLDADYLTHGVQALWFGVSGQRTDQILARVGTVTSLVPGPGSMPFITILNGGTNNAFEALTAEPWAALEPENAQVCVISSGGIYCNAVACTTGSVAPSGTSSPVLDGSCSWTYETVAGSPSALVTWALTDLMATAAALRASGAVVLVLPMTPVGQATFETTTSDANAFAVALNAELAADVGGWHDGLVPLTGAPELASPASCWYELDQVHPTNFPTCTCPLSGLPAWAPASYTASTMVQEAGLYYALEASCNSTAAPTCTSGTCVVGGCAWDVVDGSGDCTIGGFQVEGRVMGPQTKAALGM
jgi:GDSL-like Lipase/Acylhydrolase family